MHVVYLVTCILITGWLVTQLINYAYSMHLMRKQIAKNFKHWAQC